MVPKQTSRRLPGRSRAKLMWLVISAIAIVTAGVLHVLAGLSGEEEEVVVTLPAGARPSISAAGGGRFYIGEQALVAPALYASRLQVMGGDVSVKVKDEPLVLVFPGGEIRVLYGRADLKVVLQDSDDWDLMVARWGLEETAASAIALSVVSVEDGEASIRTPAEVVELDPGKPALVVQLTKGTSRIVHP